MVEVCEADPQKGNDPEHDQSDGQVEKAPGEGFAEPRGEKPSPKREAEEPEGRRRCRTQDKPWSRPGSVPRPGSAQ